MATTDATSGPDRSRLDSLWRNRDYMLLWSGQCISTIGSGVSQIAYPLLILALTRSPALTGFAFATGALPYLIFSLPAGAYVDRWDRKKVMIVCDAGRALSLASVPIAYALGHLTVVQLYITSAIEGTLFVFFNIAEVACLPRVVRKDQLPNASAQNQAAENFAFLIAPPLGGFVFQTLGKTVPFAVDAVSYAVSVLSLSLIKTKFQEERTAERRKLRVEIKEGIVWLWNQPLIRYMAFLTGGLNFGNEAAFLLLIVLARNQHAPPALIGTVFTVAGIGGLLGSLVAPRFQRRYGFGQVIVATTTFGALMWPLLALAPNPFFLGLIAAGAALTGPIYNAVQFGYRLSIIPDELQGRVNSAFRLAAFGFRPLGAALAGVLTQAIGPISTVLFFAATQLGLALITALNSHVRNARPIPFNPPSPPGHPVGEPSRPLRGTPPTPPAGEGIPHQPVSPPLPPAGEGAGG